MLTETDYRELERSWIPRNLANTSGIYRVTSAEGAQLTGRTGRADYSGLAIPYMWPGDCSAREFCLRLDHPELELKADGTFKEKAKYVFPPGRSNILYIPWGVSPEMLTDRVPAVMICEGAKKCLAIWRLATEGTEYPLFIPIGINGVWGWRGTIGKEISPDGTRRPVKGPIADLARIAWHDRGVFILFDSDKKRNSSIQAAERELALELASRGADVRGVNLQDLPGLEKTGVDDFLSHPDGGREKLLRLIDSAERPEGADPGAGPILDPSDPMPTARRFVNLFYRIDGNLSLRNQGMVFYSYADGFYREHDEPAIRAGLYTWLELARSFHKPKAPGDEPEIGPFKPNTAKVSNALDALRAITNLPTSEAAPCWLDGEAGPDPLQIIPCKNGLLYLPERRILPATSLFFSTNGLEFSFDPKAGQPAAWLEFLDQLWPDDSESKETLQEWIGYLLTPDSRQQKILMLIGPKRAGKGTIARVIGKLLGARSVCTPTLAGLGEHFGLSVLIGKTAAIIADARISGRADTAVITERLLSISGEDAQTIPRKFLPDWNGILTARFMLMTNELPRIEDASGTLASRFIVLALTESFFGRENHHLIDRFMAELPGILLWAIEGWERIHRRGHFVQPKSSLELIGQFEDLGSPIGAFVRDRCEIGVGYQIQQDHLFSEWKSWCLENGRDKPGTAQVFGRNIQSFVPWLKVERPRIMGVQVRYYTGIRLKNGV